MENRETVKKGLGMILIAVAVETCAVIAERIGSKEISAILLLVAFVFHYRGLSRLREFHRNYIVAFRCLIANIIVGIMILALAVIWALAPNSGMIIAWSAIVFLLADVVRPILSCGELYYLCDATTTLMDEAGYTKIASFGIAATAFYVSGTGLIILARLLALFFHTGIIAIILGVLVILSAVVYLAGYVLILIFLFRSRNRLN